MHLYPKETFIIIPSTNPPTLKLLINLKFTQNPLFKITIYVQS